MRTFKKSLKSLDRYEFDKTSYIDIEGGCYSETIVDDGSGFAEPGGWYDIEDEKQFIDGLLNAGYEEL